MMKWKMFNLSIHVGMAAKCEVEASISLGSKEQSLATEAPNYDNPYQGYLPLRNRKTLWHWEKQTTTYLWH